MTVLVHRDQHADRNHESQQIADRATHARVFFLKNSLDCKYAQVTGAALSQPCRIVD
jgi:hypothetical protein